MGQKYNTNQTNQRRAKNKQAFNDVMTQYESATSKSLINAMDTAKDNGFGGTLNPAAPSVIDFICDVEKAIESIIENKKVLQNFFETYIMGNDSLSKSQKNRFEQRIGRIFITRNIWPVRKYFFALRKKIE